MILAQVAANVSHSQTLVINFCVLIDFRKVVSTNHFVLLIFQRSNRIHPPYNKS